MKEFDLGERIEGKNTQKPFSRTEEGMKLRTKKAWMDKGEELEILQNTKKEKEKMGRKGGGETWRPGLLQVGRGCSRGEQGS